MSNCPNIIPRDNLSTNRVFSYQPLEVDKQSEEIIRYKSIEQVKSKSLNLLIEIIQSPSLKVGRKFVINPFGLISDSTNPNLKTRNKKDGFTYFGYIPNNTNLEIDRQIDVELPPDEKANDISLLKSQPNIENKFGRFFQISFNPEYRQYYLKDCGIGFGTFVKIQNEYIIKSRNTLISNAIKERNSINISNDLEENELNKNLLFYCLKNEEINENKIDQLILECRAFNKDFNFMYRKYIKLRTMNILLWLGLITLLGLKFFNLI